MDLVALNADVQPFATNFWGWDCLCYLLNGLGCDTSEMSECNDGETVSAATAKQWADALETALPTLIEESSNQLGQHPVLARDSYWVPAGKYQGVPLTEENRAHIQEFIDFCRQSDGFEQW